MGSSASHAVLPKRADSPLRQFSRPHNDGKIDPVLLGAGDDPMGVECEYS
jgi:hypothetical protein